MQSKQCGCSGLSFLLDSIKSHRYQENDELSLFQVLYAKLKHSDHITKRNEKRKPPDVLSHKRATGPQDRTHRRAVDCLSRWATRIQLPREKTRCRVMGRWTLWSSLF